MAALRQLHMMAIGIEKAPCKPTSLANLPIDTGLVRLFLIRKAQISSRQRLHIVLIVNEQYKPQNHNRKIFHHASNNTINP